MSEEFVQILCRISIPPQGPWPPVLWAQYLAKFLAYAIMCSMVPASSLVTPLMEALHQAPFHKIFLPMHSHKDTLRITKEVRMITLSYEIATMQPADHRTACPGAATCPTDKGSMFLARTDIHTHIHTYTHTHRGHCISWCGYVPTLMMQPHAPLPHPCPCSLTHIQT